MRILAYLTFNGCCREAMTWYRDCLGGELFFREIGNTLPGSNMPDRMNHCILHAALTRGPLQLLGTDMTDANGLLRGNTVSLSLECDNEDELMQCYRRLADGGIASYPPQHSVWGGLTGNVTDKYGNHWLLHCDSSNVQNTPISIREKIRNN